MILQMFEIIPPGLNHVRIISYARICCMTLEKDFTLFHELFVSKSALEDLAYIG